jgi:hypothetical protein
MSICPLLLAVQPVPPGHFQEPSCPVHYSSFVRRHLSGTSIACSSAWGQLGISQQRCPCAGRQDGQIQDLERGFIPLCYIPDAKGSL